MKIRLHMKNILYTCCKNINSYEDSFAYEKHLIHRCKNIFGMKICLRMKNIYTPL